MEDIIYGRNAVLEALKSGNRTFNKILISKTVHPSVKFVTFLFRNPSHDDIMKNGLLAMWPGRITEKVPYGGNDDAELEES